MRITVRVGTRYYRRFRKPLYGNVRNINIMMIFFFCLQLYEYCSRYLTFCRWIQYTEPATMYLIVPSIPTYIYAVKI